MSERMRRPAAILAVSAFALALPTAAEASAACAPEAIAGLGIHQFTVVSAEEIAAKEPSQAYCKVEGVVATDGEGAGPNSARLEMRLPEKWNSKLLFLGVGGLAGSLRPSANPHDVAASLKLGYATAITDTGHVGKNPFDTDWILRRARQTERGQDRRLLLSRAPPSNRRREGARHRLLRIQGGARLFRRLLLRRPHGPYGGHALSRRL